jgi:predicted DNA binding CopG/RHH family protein
MLKPIPEFKNEDEEREFWATHDSADYIDWDLAERVVFPKLKPSTKTISLRLSESMLNEIRLLANK